MDAINDWQIWYRQHRTIAQINDPMTTKDSREKLHDTSKARSDMPNWREFFKELADTTDTIDNDIYFQKAVEHFEDTLAEFFDELSAAQFYVAFLLAAKHSLEHKEKDYLKAKELVDLIQNKNND